MSFDEDLARRLRQLLPEAVEKSMFGGIGLMERGHLIAGVLQSDLLVRVPGEETEEWLRKPGAHRKTSGRAMNGWVMVSARALDEDPALANWVRRSRAIANR